MNKKITLSCVLLLSINAFGMQNQHQHQHDQQTQIQKKKDKKKQRWQTNDDKNGTHQQEPHAEEEDDTLADLKTDMATIMQNIIQKDISIDSYIDQQQKQKRIVLCPICHDPTCYLSKEVEE